MDRTEPSLAPQWLKTGGSATGNGTTTYSPSSSVLNSGDHALSKLTRNKSPWNHNDHDLGQSSASNRNSSSYFRRSSNSNGSTHLHSYSSFGRNTHTRDWDKDPYERRDGEKSFVGDHKLRDYLEPPFSGNLERDGLRRSQSMISGSRGEAWPKRSIADSNTAMRSKSSEGNGSLDKGNSVGSLHKVAFEREFPSLGSEEKQSASETARIPSPVLSTAIHGLPVSSSSVIGTDKWTSALAEVPTVVGGSNIGLSTGQQMLPSSLAPIALSPSTGLNMAEAVAQGPPSRAQTAPKTPTGIQKLEELAIRQSRQLIPLTPSMSKPLVLNSSDKGKGKAGQQQHATVPTPLRGVPAKTDASKISNGGKLLVLKPSRERNSGSSASMDTLSPTLGSKEAISSPAVSTLASGSATSRGSANTAVSPSAERKHVLTVQEKRTTSQSQSRNDFFDLVRKKSLSNSCVVPDASSAVMPSTADEAGELEVTDVPVTPEERDTPLVDFSTVCQPTEDKINPTSNTQVFHKEGNLQNGKNHVTSLPQFSEEEEVAFLHKLGWQENAEEGDLTEEEINAFFTDLRKHMISKPSKKILQVVQLKFPMFSSHVAAVSSGLSSTDSNVES